MFFNICIPSRYLLSTYFYFRYKVQKHIIALQKAKLEQQNKEIEELKYNKIIEASKQSLSCMRDEVRKTYYEIDKHLKPKIKCLTNELNIKEIEGDTYDNYQDLFSCFIVKGDHYPRKSCDAHEAAHSVIFL